MEFEIGPEPSPEEREALERALARPPPDPRGAWWRAGVEESLVDGEDAD
jgi:hypothetical protein